MFSVHVSLTKETNWQLVVLDIMAIDSLYGKKIADFTQLHQSTM